MIVLIDNYDSFTYNLYQLIRGITTEEVVVIRNDDKSVEEIMALAPSSLVISPGPSSPQNAGVCIDLIRQAAPTIPIFGVCLGLQAMAAAFGGKVIRAPKVVHGKASCVFHRGKGIFNKVPVPFTAARYHSLLVERQSLPKELVVEADTADGEVMALKHETYPCYGVQFHPESILTPHGALLLRQFFSETCHVK